MIAMDTEVAVEQPTTVVDQVLTETSDTNLGIETISQISGNVETNSISESDAGEAVSNEESDFHLVEELLPAVDVRSSVDQALLNEIVDGYTGVVSGTAEPMEETPALIDSGDGLQDYRLDGVSDSSTEASANLTASSPEDVLENVVQSNVVEDREDHSTINSSSDALGLPFAVPTYNLPATMALDATVVPNEGEAMTAEVEAIPISAETETKIELKTEESTMQEFPQHMDKEIGSTETTIESPETLASEVVADTSTGTSVEAIGLPESIVSASETSSADAASMSATVDVETAEVVTKVTNDVQVEATSSSSESNESASAASLVGDASAVEAAEEVSKLTNDVQVEAAASLETIDVAPETSFPEAATTAVEATEVVTEVATDVDSEVISSSEAISSSETISSEAISSSETTESVSGISSETISIQEVEAVDDTDSSAIVKDDYQEIEDSGPVEQAQAVPVVPISIVEESKVDDVSDVIVSQAVKAAEEDKVKVTSDTDSDDEDDIPQLEDVEPNQEPNIASEFAGAGTDPVSRAKQSRSEKKARKAMAKLNLKTVSGVTRVTIRKSKNILFVINKPDVFRSPAGDTHIVFGEAKIEDLSQQAQVQAAEKFKAPEPTTTAAELKEEIPSADEDDDEEADGEGIEEKDIDLVMQQANVSKKKAIKALKKMDNDIVNAIMDLTM